MVKKRSIYLGLGSNIGDRMWQLKQASFLLTQHFGKIISKSSIYETAAWGMENQDDFLNQVVEFTTSKSPTVVFERIMRIEKKMGRVRLKKWGPRTIDIDLLFYGELVINRPNLKVPHQRIAERKFVLIPMEEIAPSFLHPVLNKSIKALNLACIDHQAVKRFN